MESTDDEGPKLKAEVKTLRNNIERLEILYKESLSEVGKIKSEYESKLIEANDRFTFIDKLVLLSYCI